MSRNAGRGDPIRILDVVAVLLADKGVDGWVLSEVAAQAHSSLTTIYKHFGARDELIVSAVERWMQQNIYNPIPSPSPSSSPFEALTDMFRAIFEPWEEHPEMLHVFVRASATPGRDRLRAQGQQAVAVVFEKCRAELRTSFVDDLNVILTSVVEGAMTRYLNGEIEVIEIRSAVEKALLWLERGYYADLTAGGGRRTGRVHR